MTITAVAASRSNASPTPQQTLAGNFDTFLKLLTTQLRQQDPLQPMDATQFTSQLVQYASVEQAIATNKKLEDLSTLTQASSTASALGMLGHDVTVAGDKVQLGAAGEATIAYRLPAAAQSVTISMLDSAGRVVFTTMADGTAAGDNSFAWNGLNADAQRVPAGTYRIKIDSVGADGSKLAAEQLLRGRVDGIETENGEVRLFVGGVTVPIAAVRDVRRAA
jgi:flagellar basal-body rod modification protein FlgD